MILAQPRQPYQTCNCPVCRLGKKFAPVRLQLSRERGFNLQRTSRRKNGLEAVKVDRTTRFGNPCRIGMYRGYTREDAMRDYRRWFKRDPGAPCYATDTPPTVAEIREHLGGKNLACWCPLDADCHADDLLKLANPASHKPIRAITKKGSGKK